MSQICVGNQYKFRGEGCKAMKIRLCKRCFFRCGKTTICQLFAAMAGQKFFAVNCHLHMETSDFLGGLRPVRHTGTRQVRYPEALMDTAPLVRQKDVRSDFAYNTLNILTSVLQNFEKRTCFVHAIDNQEGNLCEHLAF